jgi:uncharacterized repeat protein (TIGR03803 family)
MICLKPMNSVSSCFTQTGIKNLVLIPLLLAMLGFTAVAAKGAHAFKNLHNFSGSDGIAPYAGLIVSGSTLYGTTVSGGTPGFGTVFAVHIDGSGFTNLYNFTGEEDGYYPMGGLVLSGHTLYGTTALGTSAGNGAVFALHTDGTGFRSLHIFTRTDPMTGTNEDGAGPQAGLIISSNILFGTAYLGGRYSHGTLFSLNTDGTDFKTLHNFTATADAFNTNADGAAPAGRLIRSGNILYGTAAFGGTANNGTLFAVRTDGMGFTTLHSFTATTQISGLNDEGARPCANLIPMNGILYGTASEGGASGNGTIFAVATNGTNFRILHTFTATPYYSYANSDGAAPYSGLLSLGQTLYGTASKGGKWAKGTVFAMNIDGTRFTNLFDFTPGPDSLPFINRSGAYPMAGLVFSRSALYGTAYVGGTAGNGTVFSLSLRPIRPIRRP